MDSSTYKSNRHLKLNMTITKVIFFSKPARLILFSHLSKQLHSSRYLEENLFSFSHIPHPSANHISFLAALTLYLSHLYTLVQASIILFLDHCSDLLSSCFHPCSTTVSPAHCDAFKTWGKITVLYSKHASLFKIQHRACDTLHNVAPGYFSGLICILITYSAVVASIYSSVPQICQVHCILRPLHF